MKRLKEGYTISYRYEDTHGLRGYFIAQYDTDIEALISSGFKTDIDDHKVLSYSIRDPYNNIVIDDNDAFEEITKPSINIDTEVREHLEQELDGMTIQMLRAFYFDRRYQEVKEILLKGENIG